MSRARFAALALATAVALGGCSLGDNSDDDYRVDDCAPRDLDGRSVARVWNEALLDAIRRDTPAPTVHARNLFHLSAVMWDAWAAYEPDARGYFVREKRTAEDVAKARETAISFAAYRVLLHRYSLASGPPGDLRRARGDDGIALPPRRLHRDRGRLAGRARKPHRRPRYRPSGRTTARTRHAATPTRPTSL